MESQADAVKQRRWPSLWGILEAGTMLLCLVTTMTFLGRAGWIFELTAHFRVQYAVISGILILIWLIKKRWRLGLIAALVALINFGLVEAVAWAGREKGGKIGPHFRLATINVHSENRRSDLLLSFLKDTDADVILLMETNDRWLKALEPLRRNYPYMMDEVREDDFGIALFSRLPMTNNVVIDFSAAKVPSIRATLLVGGRQVELLGTHPLPPGSEEYSRQRNDQLRQIATFARQQRRPVIVAGDLNITPWSPYFADLLRNGQLRNTSQGRGLFASWPSDMIWARIPIDHCLISQGLNVTDKRLGPTVGSDHLPVVIDLTIDTDK